MKRYSREEVSAFLAAVDRHLTERIDLIVIGGSAALLAYDATRPTSDIDTYNAIPKEFIRAHANAVKETGLKIPLSQAGIADGPCNFEDRLQSVFTPNLKWIHILVPEPMDLILMKIIRGQEHDFEVIAEMIASRRIEAAELIRLYKAEMNTVIGDKRKIAMNFIVMIEKNFPDIDLDSLQRELGFA